jgi:HPr kinase/phosphorylase
VASATVHATCVVLREAGILIRGPSGSGKSRLAGELLARASGGFARLVCDDRLGLENRSGRLVAREVPAIAGRIEVRGLGLMPVPHEPAAVVRLVVDVSPDHGERLPEEEDATVDVCGVLLPRLAGRLESLAAAALWQVNVIMTG